MPDPFFSPLALILIPLGCLSLWPLTARLTPRNGETAHLIESGLLAFTLSPALLTVILFWLGLLPGAWITPVSVLIVVLASWGMSLLINPHWLRSLPLRSTLDAIWDTLRRLDVQSIILWTLIGVCWIMIMHALYYPFNSDDALSRYGPYAKALYFSQRITPEINGYPPLVPMMWASIWFAAGHINEHLARLYSVFMTIGTLGATHLLGHEIGGRRLGITAALVQALTPLFFLFGTWDFVDIPTALPLTLSLIFLLRWWKSGSVRDALLAGVLTTVGMFTKQAALTWLASHAALFALALINSLRSSSGPRFWSLLGSALGLYLPALLLAFPWYYRNLVLIGLWFPTSGLWHVVGPNAGGLGIIPAVARPADFGYPLIPAYVLGWVAGLIRAVRQGIQTLIGRLSKAPSHLILGLYIVPYWLVWWYTFSFEGHYLLLVTPIMAIWAAEVVLWLMDQLAQRLMIPSIALRLISALTLLVLLLYAARGRYGAIYYALTRPFATEAERLHHVQPVLSDMIDYIQTHMDRNDRIMVMDGRYNYYLPDYQITPAYPLRLSEIEGFDYLIHASGLYGIYDDRLGWDQSEFFLNVWNPQYFESVYESGGVHIMRILPQGEAN